MHRNAIYFLSCVIQMNERLQWLHREAIERTKMTEWMWGLRCQWNEIDWMSYAPSLQKLRGISSCCLRHGVLPQAQRFCCWNNENILWLNDRIVSLVKRSWTLRIHNKQKNTKFIAFGYIWSLFINLAICGCTNLSLSSTFSSERSRSCSIRTSLRATCMCMVIVC